MTLLVLRPKQTAVKGVNYCLLPKSVLLVQTLAGRNDMPLTQ